MSSLMCVKSLQTDDRLISIIVTLLEIELFLAPLPLYPASRYFVLIFPPNTELSWVLGRTGAGQLGVTTPDGETRDKCHEFAYL